MEGDGGLNSASEDEDNYNGDKKRAWNRYELR